MSIEFDITLNYNNAIWLIISYIFSISINNLWSFHFTYLTLVKSPIFLSFAFTNLLTLTLPLFLFDFCIYFLLYTVSYVYLPSFYLQSLLFLFRLLYMLLVLRHFKYVAIPLFFLAITSCTFLLHYSVCLSSISTTFFSFTLPQNFFSNGCYSCHLFLYAIYFTIHAPNHLHHPSFSQNP